jgi:hypothetical protein
MYMVQEDTMKWGGLEHLVFDQQANPLVEINKSRAQ